MFVRTLRAPVGDTATRWTKVEFDGFASNVCDRRSMDVDVFAFMVVDPECTVTTANRAVAGGCAFRVGVELPTHCTAVTLALQHLVLLLSIVVLLALCGPTLESIGLCLAVGPVRNGGSLAVCCNGPGRADG